MTLFIIFLAVLTVAAVVGLTRTIRSDKPSRLPAGPSYWSGSNLPSGPYSTAS